MHSYHKRRCLPNGKDNVCVIISNSFLYEYLEKNYRNLNDKFHKKIIKIS
jgi:hypothetical protein